MRKSIVACILPVIGVLAAAPLAAAVESPKEVIQNTIDKLVAVVESTTDRQQRREKMRAVIEPEFDFAEMAKSSLRRYWDERTEAERAEFVKTFSDLLAKTYLDRIGNIERGMVTVKGERVADPRAIVKTSVAYKGDVFPIDYKMVKAGGKWKVYDVVIENIGLVANYRNEFAGIIRRENFSGLMQKLRDKLTKPEGAK